MTPIDLASVRQVFFVGIGGIGMSGLARHLAQLGSAVSGYDRTATELTEQLIAEGIAVTLDINQLPPPGTDLVVRTPAVHQHPAYGWAATAGVPVLKRAELLGALSRKYRTLAVAGTHGKTTTSALLSHLLRYAGADPTAFVGGVLNRYATNYFSGQSDLLVVEADEFDRSFWQLAPERAIITSVAPDHLDIYGSAETVREGYRGFAQRLPPTGLLLAHEAVSTALAGAVTAPVHTYGLGENVDNRALNLRHERLGVCFDYRGQWGETPGLYLPMPGAHNALNALAAFTLARSIGLPAEVLRAALADFPGVDRRYTVHLQTDSWALIDDYAHHPDEIEAALAATRNYLPGWRLVVVFQPHLYTRTRDFADGFAASLRAADVVFLLDIYPAREEPIVGITSDIIFQQIHTSQKHTVTLGKVPTVVPSALSALPPHPTAVLVLGAGDIATAVRPLADALRNLGQP